MILQHRQQQKQVSDFWTSSGDSHTAPASADAIFRFLDLPAELRTAIYEWLFAGSSTFIISCGKGHVVKHFTADGVECFGLPALLRTNRQLREEALAVFYAKTSIRRL